MFYNTNFKDISFNLLNISDTLHLNYNIIFKKIYFYLDIITHSDISYNHYIKFTFFLLYISKYRQLACTVGTIGFLGCITRLKPQAKKSTFFCQKKQTKI